MLNKNISQLKFSISQLKGVHKLFATAILLFAIVYPSSLVQAAQSNDNKHFNNAFGQQNSEPEVNIVGDEPQPLVVAGRYYGGGGGYYRRRGSYRYKRGGYYGGGYYKRYPVRRRVIIINPGRRYRGQSIYRPGKRYPVRRIHRRVRPYYY